MDSLDDFEVGQEVWCVEICNKLHNQYEPDLSIWAAKGEARLLVMPNKIEKVAVQNGDIISDQNRTNHKTKNEAIDEIIMSLMELKDKP